jgi:hypothetical protein
VNLTSPRALQDGDPWSGNTGAASDDSPFITANLALREQRMLEIAEKLQQLVGRQNRNLRLLADGALRQVGSCVVNIFDILRERYPIHDRPLSAHLVLLLFLSWAVGLLQCILALDLGSQLSFPHQMVVQRWAPGIKEALYIIRV